MAVNYKLYQAKRSDKFNGKIMLTFASKNKTIIL